MTEHGTTMRALTGMIALELAVAAASTAQASESWVVAGGDDKPDRDLVLVEVRNGIVKDYATGGNSCDALIR